MAYLLDSDILIFQMRGHEKVRRRMLSVPMSQLHFDHLVRGTMVRQSHP